LTACHSSFNPRPTLMPGDSLRSQTIVNKGIFDPFARTFQRGSNCVLTP
jgi:hypothetical protein